jgi:hypothetical protein
VSQRLWFRVGSEQGSRWDPPDGAGKEALFQFIKIAVASLLSWPLFMFAQLANAVIYVQNRDEACTQLNSLALGQAISVSHPLLLFPLLALCLPLTFLHHRCWAASVGAGGAAAGRHLGVLVPSRP